jgi:hypothetical protein
VKTFLIEYKTKTGTESEIISAASIANALRTLMQQLRVRGMPVMLKVLGVKILKGIGK